MTHKFVFADVPNLRSPVTTKMVKRRATRDHPVRDPYRSPALTVPCSWTLVARVPSVEGWRTAADSEQLAALRQREWRAAALSSGFHLGSLALKAKLPVRYTALFKCTTEHTRYETIKLRVLRVQTNKKALRCTPRPFAWPRVPAWGDQPGGTLPAHLQCHHTVNLTTG